ncbi:MAG: peptide chain release factor N(5)-glutamine methyltransferase [Prevotellaceae bacterium]|jgi:release factor glutamine methyltransferase|nr:peptide chain release factor N(5)-glutamine methyltransferase [Prevotellaceae bacterium]
MTVAILHRQSVRQLQSAYDAGEAKALSYALLSHFAGLSRTQLYASPDTALTDAVTSRIQAGVTALLDYKPLQYITGETLFCGFPITVTEAVLIPRPETEELVRWTVSQIALTPEAGIADCPTTKTNGNTAIVSSYRVREWAPRIIDLCTGSGCIAVTLAGMLPSATVYACDNSPAALEIAQRNAARNGVDVHCFRYDLLAPPAFDCKVDCIVCNPPYVRHSEKAQIAPNVLRYEPPEALFVDDSDPLLFYRAIARFATHYLHAGGKIFMEINEALGRETKALFHSSGFPNVEVRKDINGKERMIMVQS